MVHARNGAAISIEKAWKKLGIEVVWEGHSLYDFGQDVPLPMEYSVQSKWYGFHSTLMVDYVKKCRCYRITNFERETSIDGWIFGEDLYKHKSFCSQRDCNMFRLFAMKGIKEYTYLKRKWKRDKKAFFKNSRRGYIERCRQMGVK